VISVGSTTTLSWVSDATAVIFFVKCFRPSKTPFSVRKHKEAVCFVGFTYNSHLLKYVNCTAVMALLLSFSLHCCYQRIFNQKTNYFEIKHVDWVFPGLYRLIFLFKLSGIFKIYKKKQKKSILWTQSYFTLSALTTTAILQASKTRNWVFIVAFDGALTSLDEVSSDDSQFLALQLLQLLRRLLHENVFIVYLPPLSPNPSSHSLCLGLLYRWESRLVAADRLLLPRLWGPAVPKSTVPTSVRRPSVVRPMVISRQEV